MSVYTEVNNIAHNISNIYIGDNNNLALKIAKAYVGDGNSIARQVYQMAPPPVANYTTVGVQIDENIVSAYDKVDYIDESGYIIDTPPVDAITELISGIVLVNKPKFDFTGMTLTSDVTSNDTIIDDNGGGGSTVAGTDVFCRIPKMGWKITKEGSIVKVYLTNDPNKEGFAYHAHSRVTEGDRNYLYIACYTASGTASGIYSCRSKAIMNGTLSCYNMTIGARARGGSTTERNGTRWGYDIFSYYSFTLLDCLWAIIYKSVGRAQGGAGNIASTAMLATGGTYGKSITSSGNIAVPNVTGRDGLFFGESTNKLQMKFLGIEDFTGNAGKSMSGIFTYGGGTHMIYTDYPTSNAEIDSHNNIIYSYTGYTQVNPGWTSVMDVSNEIGFMPVANASAGTGVSYNWGCYKGLRTSNYNTFYQFGYYSNGGVAAPFTLYNSATINTNATTSTSTRLMFL